MSFLLQLGGAEQYVAICTSGESTKAYGPFESDAEAKEAIGDLSSSVSLGGAWEVAPLGRVTKPGKAGRPSTK